MMWVLTSSCQTPSTAMMQASPSQLKRARAPLGEAAISEHLGELVPDVVVAREVARGDLIAWTWQPAVHLVDDPPRRAVDHQDSVGQVDRLLDVVRNEHDRRARLGLNVEQLIVQR